LISHSSSPGSGSREVVFDFAQGKRSGKGSKRFLGNFEGLRRTHVMAPTRWVTRESCIRMLGVGRTKVTAVKTQSKYHLNLDCDPDWIDVQACQEGLSQSRSSRSAFWGMQAKARADPGTNSSGPQRCRLHVGTSESAQPLPRVHARQQAKVGVLFNFLNGEKDE
jgi:hypothetical protein